MQPRPVLNDERMQGVSMSQRSDENTAPNRRRSISVGPPRRGKHHDLTLLLFAAFFFMYIL